jgi:hypothetical protein
MKLERRASRLVAPSALCTLCALLALAGCANSPFQRDSGSAGSGSSASTQTAAAPAAAKPRPAWLSESGEVLDSSKVEAGFGQKVKGRKDFEGEITGKPAPGTKFTRLEIGMSRAEVLDIVGPPNDQGAYVTGRAFIPFFFGGDRYRHELAYKGQGRLVFAGGAGFDSNAHLIWIIHNARDTGYR